ncbi:MAG: DUF2125 domain-containing protein [Pseudomonadota bacterium]
MPSPSRHVPRSLAVPVACFALAATSAAAEVTAADVWRSWQGSFAAAGEELALRTGPVSAAGNGLTVADAALVFAPDMAPAQGEFRMEVALGDIVFAEDGDGAVAVTLTEEIPITLTGVDEAGEPFSARFLMTLGGTDIRASGSPEALRHEATSREVALQLEEMRPQEDGEAVDIAVTLTGLTQSSVVEEGDPRRTSFTTAIDTLAYALSADIPGDGSFSLDYQSLDYAVAGSVALPDGSEGSDEVGTLLADDSYAVRFEATSSASAGNLSFEDTAPGGDVDFGGASGSVDITAGAGAQSLTLAEGAVSYEGRADAFTAAMLTDQLPVPVSVALGGSTFTFATPLSPREAEGEIRLGLALRELALDDFIWDLFDPAAVLPRDPATLVIDLAGLGRWLVDPFNESALAAQEDDELPGEVSGARIEALELSAAGARVTADGAVRFDYSDRETFDGLPAPEGQLTARLEGVGGLLDKLVMMGLLPQEQSMGARLMLGLFASPVPGQEDTFTSTLAVEPDGSVFANGQQIR